LAKPDLNLIKQVKQAMAVDGCSAQQRVIAECNL
jgi:hypothetical protein